MNKSFSSKAQHVIPKGGSWGVQRSGSFRASKIFDTQKEAISYAKNIAISQKSSLIIHGKTGIIKDSESYGNDPFPPRDKSKKNIERSSRYGKQ